MKTSPLVIAVLLTIFAGVWSTHAQRTDSRDTFPQEDFETYQKALTVKDYEMQRLAVRAMSYYPEGYPILLEIVRTNNTDRGTGYYAAIGLTNFNKLPSYEKDLKKLLVDLDKAAKEKAAQNNISTSVRSTVARNLFIHSPKTYADEMITSLQAHLKKSGRDISFSDTWASDLNLLVSVTDKKKLYGFVPLLVDNMEAFFSDNQDRAYKSLVLITGVDYPFQRNSSESRRESMEKYRELYYTKLKPQMAK